jgi:hypothetical protein
MLRVLTPDQNRVRHVFTVHQFRQLETIRIRPHGAATQVNIGMHAQLPDVRQRKAQQTIQKIPEIQVTMDITLMGQTIIIRVRHVVRTIM